MNRLQLVNQSKHIILKHCKPHRIWVYGSEAMGESTETSDIDMAYITAKSDDAMFKLDQIKNEIDQLSTLVKVDITNLAYCDERFTNRVKTTGKVIYSANTELRAEDAIFNFGKALSRFNEAIEEYESDDWKKNELMQQIFIDVLVKRFEFTYEMSWKAIKRVLAHKGIEANSPRSCFKEGFSQNWVADQNIVLEMIEMRNLTAHTYDLSSAQEILTKAKTYKTNLYHLFSQLNDALG